MPKRTKKKAASKEPIRAKRNGIDPIGASKDGHQFHEAWLARRSLGLIFSRDGLCGITVEGLSRDIEEGAPTEAIEIADATFFYGKQPTFAKATRIDVTQFKYSIARDQTPMRFSDAKKPIVKFSTAETGFIKSTAQRRRARNFDIRSSPIVRSRMTLRTLLLRRGQAANLKAKVRRNSTSSFAAQSR